MVGCFLKPEVSSRGCVVKNSLCVEKGCFVLDSINLRYCSAKI